MGILSVDHLKSNKDNTKIKKNKESLRQWTCVTIIIVVVHQQLEYDKKHSSNFSIID